MKTTRNTTTIKTKGPEITKLIMESRKPISRIAENLNNVSEKSLQRMAKGEKVGDEIIDSLAKYFKVNVNEIADTENYLYLDRIQSWPELYSNENYQFSRKYSDHSNHLSHKLYKIDEFSDSILDDIENFLKILYTNQNEESSDRGTEDDVEKEIKYLRKLNNANLCFKKLIAQGIGVYYGHYNHRHFQKLNIAVEPDSISMRGIEIGDYQTFNSYIPNGFRVEVIYFYKTNDYKKNENFVIPNKIKIFPETGYTKKELYEVYVSAIKNRSKDDLQTFKEKKFPDNEKGTRKKLITEGIIDFIDNFFNKHETNLWLSASDEPFGFKFLNDFKKDVSEYVKNFKHILTGKKLDKYNGPVEEGNDWTHWSNFLEESKENVSDEEFIQLNTLRKKYHEQAQRLRDYERYSARERAQIFKQLNEERRSRLAEIADKSDEIKNFKKLSEELARQKISSRMKLKDAQKEIEIKKKKKEDAM